MCVSALSFAKRFALCKRYQLLLFYSDDKLNKRRQKSKKGYKINGMRKSNMSSYFLQI